MVLSIKTQKFINYLRLMRIHKPIPIFLMFLPIAIIVFTQYFVLNIKNFPFLKLILVSFFGSFFVRSLGCIINDYFDQDIDKKTERTKDRPLTLENLEVKPTKFGIFLLIGFLISISLFFAYTLGTIPFVLSLLSGLMVIFYPLMKRIFILPQLFLGIVYNMGIIIISSALEGGINSSAIVFFIINILWTLAYDTVYAAQDIEDDEKNNVHSSVRTFGKNWPIVIDKIYNVVFGLLIIFGVVSKFVASFYIFTIISFVIMKYQFQKMRVLKRYQNFFEYNVLIFTIILIGVIFEIIFKNHFI
jgi:4-hydroxybenzoate polyprenyltransferase